jgi:hypothetical protein
LVFSFIPLFSIAASAEPQRLPVIIFQIYLQKKLSRILAILTNAKILTIPVVSKKIKKSFAETRSTSLKIMNLKLLLGNYVLQKKS